MGIAPAHAATSLQRPPTRSGSLAHDEFNRTEAPLGALLSGSLGDRLSYGVAEAAERRGHVERLHAGANHACLAAGGVSAERASGRLVRLRPDLPHSTACLYRTVVRRQANGRACDVGSGARQRSGLAQPEPREQRCRDNLRVPVAATLTSNQVLNMQTRVVGSRRVHRCSRLGRRNNPAGLADRVRRLEPGGHHDARGGRRQRLDGSGRIGSVGHADSLPHSAIGGTGDHGGPGSCR